MTLPGLPTNYRVDHLINSGGTAAVYCGVDRYFSPEKKVAIKKLFPERIKDDFIIDCFRKEANYYLHLSHPNIVKLTGYVEDMNKGIFYLIMEYVDGTPLDAYLAKTGPMNDKTLIPLFCQILDAIDYLHHFEIEEEILHLDIKPGNIMVLKNRQIKILDMGISAKLNDKKRNPKKCGTPAFMAPEQINKEELGRYTDIFALGVTLFNLVTGELPFPGNSHTGIFEKICNEPTPIITDFYSDANPDFQIIIERALQKKGIERYQTCKEFKEDLLKINNKQNYSENTKEMKTVTVGRDPSNTIVIDNDPFIGRNHLEIVFDNSGNVKLTDLFSRNGTLVNGKKIISGEEVCLSSTDIVKIGNTLLPWKNWKNSGTTTTDPNLPPKPNWWEKWGKTAFQYVWRIVLGIITMLITYYVFSLIRK